MKCFVSESELFILRMSKRSLVHFKKKMVRVNHEEKETYFARFKKDLENLLREFQNRFSDFVQSSSDFMFSADPFSIIVDPTPGCMQLEAVDLQNNEILKFKHRESATLGFHRALGISSYFMLGRKPMKLMPLSGSTYVYLRTEL